MHQYQQCATLRVPLVINVTVKPAAGPSYFFSYYHILTRQILLLIGIVGLVSSPMRGAWLSLSRTGRKVVTEPLRTVRRAQGKQEAEIASAGEKEKVIDTFKLATRKDVAKARRMTMEERLKDVLRDGGAGTLTTEKKEGKENDVPNISLASPLASTFADEQELMSPIGMEVDEEEARLEKELEQAIAASAKRALNAEDEEERFERESKMAMELSLKEEEDFERGLVQVAECTAALPQPKT
jgi:hypothetical protein